MKKVNVTDMVKVKEGLAKAVLSITRDKKFYHQMRTKQFELMNELVQMFNVIYNVEKEVKVVDIRETEFENLNLVKYGMFLPTDEESKKIIINRPSMITLLNCYRKFLHHEGIINEPALGHVEIDVIAWSTRVFKLACPKSFEKSVKAGNVAQLTWDEEKGAVMELPDTMASCLEILYGQE